MTKKKKKAVPRVKYTTVYEAPTEDIRHMRDLLRYEGIKARYGHSIYTRNHTLEIDQSKKKETAKLLRKNGFTLAAKGIREGFIGLSF